MAEEGKIFHESWYRIANKHICLKPSVAVQRQFFRGAKWYVLRDPFTNQFFRLRPSAYEFVARLSMQRTVEEVWKELIDNDPSNAPGQEDVIELLAQLYHYNLLHYDLAEDSAKLFERFKQRKQMLFKATLMNLMFFRVPLLDPDKFIKRLLPAVRLLMSPLGAALWLLVVIGGIKVAFDNFSELQSHSQGILAPSNLILLYLGLVFIKAMHEFGHAFAVRRFGGEVHNMGIMFLIFNPVPYMDATAAWSFRSKWKRAVVGAAGMVVEVFFAALALFVWANTGAGIINSLAYNIVFIASVSTILFNINPLMRFDGYYILSDLIDIPNLHQKARQQLTHIVERYAFGCKKSKSVASSAKEAFGLTFFGITSGIYGVVVFSSILLFVADRFLLAGIIMAIVCAISWLVVPCVQLVRYLATSPRLERKRARAIWVSVGALAFCFGFLYFCPFPNNFKVSGVLEAQEHIIISNKAKGVVQEILAPSGTLVKPHEPLVSLSNDELEFQIKQVQAEIKEAQAMLQLAMFKSQADLKPLNEKINFLGNKLKRLYEDKDNLIVRAEISGIWAAPEIQDFVGMLVNRGTPLGKVINDTSFYFTSVIPQQQVSRLFAGEVKSSAVKLSGQSEITIPVLDYIKIPMEHTNLPSAALGWAGGGEVAIDTTDSRGIKAAEPFYELKARISLDTKASLLHGRSGRMMFTLEKAPLLRQWWRNLRQLVQKRYQI